MWHRLSYIHDAASPRYPGNPENRVRPVLSMSAGHACNAAEVVLFTHNGTHVDLPNHYHADGRRVADYAVEELIFSAPALVPLALGPAQPITPELLRPASAAIGRADLLLLRTGFGARRRDPAYLDNPYLTVEAARYLRTFPRLRAVGVDCLSIANPALQALGDEVHRVLLHDAPDGKPVVIIEDLDLTDAAAVERLTRIFVVPLFVDGVDGMPCTVFGDDGR